MKYADVLINLPSTSLNKIFTYAIPENLEGEVQFGKRVLVEFGSNHIEAYVVAVKDTTLVKNIKNIVHVLDSIPVINQHLWELANWIAETYLCPVSMVLNSMVPKAITKTKAQVIIPVISKEDYFCHPAKDLLTKYESFLNDLWTKRELSLSHSKKYITNDDINYLVETGIIKLINKRLKVPTRKVGYVYKLGINFTDNDLLKLHKRAPKQAEFITFLKKNNSIDCKKAEEFISKNVIISLLNKGFIKKEKTPTYFYPGYFSLTNEQKSAIEIINNSLNNGVQEILLYGITGSGKTEVYISSAEYYIAQGKNILMLIPEIALTEHLVQAISQRVNNIAVLHSNMSNGERFEAWERIRSGEVNFVLGTRSAIFAPIENLGLIIIDEEQENTYKQEETPKYDARQVAQKRAQLENAVVLYGSATPSLELFYRAHKGEVKLITLENRVGTAKLPYVHIENLRNNQIKTKSILGTYLQDKIKQTLLNNEQTILFINRRGYSPTTICRKCGSTLTCPYCSVGLTYHKDLQLNICHYCNYTVSFTTKCPSCNSDYLQQIGMGTQKVEEEVKELFPLARIDRLDLDVSRKGAGHELLNRMKNKEIDILIGTQMVAKGLDFPNVSLVGIVDVDSMLGIPDFRAAERTFQLLVQAAGRAGRGNKPGEVVIQTYNPENSVIAWAAEQEYTKFYFEEIKLRKILNYPPFSSLLRIVISSSNIDMVVQKAETIAELVKEITDAKEDYLQILGPAPCPIYKLKNKYRYQLIVKSHNVLLLRSIGQYIIVQSQNSSIKVEIDINPNSMM